MTVDNNQVHTELQIQRRPDLFQQTIRVKFKIHHSTSHGITIVKQCQTEIARVLVPFQILLCQHGFSCSPVTSKYTKRQSLVRTTEYKMSKRGEVQNRMPNIDLSI